MARVMRQVLVDHARGYRRQARWRRGARAVGHPDRDSR
jgi:hypothetical protein